MPSGRNSVFGPATSPVFDPEGVSRRRIIYRGVPFDLPPFHVHGFVTELAQTPGYPAREPLLLTSATVVVESTGGTSITFVIKVNGVVVDTFVASTPGLWIHPTAIEVATNDIVTMEITDIGTGALYNFLVVLRATPGVVAPVVPDCIPGVMGSPSWFAPYDDVLDYDAGGDFYWNSAGALGPQPMYWPDAFAGQQSIEATVTNFGPRVDEGGDVFTLWCRSTDPTSYDSGIQFWARKYEDSVDGPLWQWFVQADGVEIFAPPGDFPSGLLFWPYGDLSTPVTFRLESDVDGAFRVFVNDVVLYADTDPTQSASATQIGWSIDRFYGSDVDMTAHISNICIIAE